MVELLGPGTPLNGWGRNQAFELDGAKVFVKRIPVTGIEHENIFSTANLYNLPMYYNYGLGSTGFSVWRELVAHIKTTNWILSGENEHFPLLYHYRLVPMNATRAEEDKDAHNRFVEYWNGNQSIGQYMVDRANAKVELLLFLEHIPNTLHEWIKENPEQIGKTLDQLHDLLDFLQKNEIIHLDAHSENVLTDGKNVYLTDFGLLVDKCFSLQEDEVAFFDEHRLFDYAEVLSEVGYLVYSAFKTLPEDEQTAVMQQLNGAEETRVYKICEILLENVEEIHSDQLFPLNQTLFETAVKYRPITKIIIRFFRQMQKCNQKNIPYPNEEIERLLAEAEFMPDT